jgi:hypothetical protein
MQWHSIITKKLRKDKFLKLEEIEKILPDKISCECFGQRNYISQNVDMLSEIYLLQQNHKIQDLTELTILELPTNEIRVIYL